jgi:hypothetical protein
VPPPPAPPTHTSQPNPTKNPAPDTTTLQNTLEKLRSLQKQTQPPKARTNPLHGGAPNSGGNPNGDITDKLSAAQRGAIGEKVRECWTKDPEALDLDKMSVQLKVTADAQGILREAVVGEQDLPRLADPRFRAFAERALRAVLDPHCADQHENLKHFAGRIQQLTFRFRP